MFTASTAEGCVSPLPPRRAGSWRFGLAFFDLCDDKCLQQPEVALDYARLAVELAKKIDDPHLLHGGQGVLAHAHIANGELSGAAEILEGYRVRAFECCGSCAADWLRRRGDVLVETRDASGAHEAIERALAELGPDVDDDQRGRLRFIRGIAYHREEKRDLALEDAGEALLEMSLSTPQGYFLDATAFVACFLQHGGERRHYDKALDYLSRFRERLPRPDPLRAIVAPGFSRAQRVGSADRGRRLAAALRLLGPAAVREGASAGHFQELHA